MAKTYPFYAPSGLLQTWSLNEGVDGCMRSPIAGLCIGLDKAAPEKKDKEAETLDKLPIERNAKASGYFKGALRQLIEERRIKAEAAAATVKSAPAQAKTSKPHTPNDKPPVPFDLQDIPASMRKLGWHKSAELMEQWFQGRLNYSRTKSDESKGFDQNGKPYASEFIETTRFTWEWLRKYGAVDKAFNAISAQDYLTSNKANASGQSAYTGMRANVLAAVARRRHLFMGTINSKEECGDDLMELHRRYQFQHYDLNILSYPNTDLGGSLGDFSIYAAIANIEVKRQDFAPHTATVTHVYLYVKDNFSFTDDPSGPSQYLGHWNKTGVVYAPLETATALAKKIPLFGKYVGEIPSGVWDRNPQGADFPVFMESDPDMVYYPAHNRDFLNWQMKHQRGGNIISFSDLKSVRLEQPIQFQIPN
jgi:Family of unknown function (DUF6402)